MLFFLTKYLLNKRNCPTSNIKRCLDVLMAMLLNLSFILILFLDKTAASVSADDDKVQAQSNAFKGFFKEQGLQRVAEQVSSKSSNLSLT